MDSLIQFGFENFKMFKERTMFEVAPITLFVGPNNSGKSTVLNGLHLLVDSANSGGLESLNLNKFRNVLGDYSKIKSYGSESDEIRFITGVHADTPLVDYAKVKIGEEFPYIVFKFFIERIYTVRKNVALLRKILFFKDKNLKNEILSLEFKNKNSAVLSFDFREFLKMNGIEKINLININAIAETNELSTQAKLQLNSKIEKGITDLLFKDVKINILPNSSHDKNEYTIKYNHRPDKESAFFAYSYEVKLIKKEGEKITVSDIIYDYYRHLIHFMEQDINIGEFFFKMSNSKSKFSFLLNVQKLMNKDFIKDMIDSRMIFLKIHELELKPYYLWFTPFMDVTRASSKRINSTLNQSDSFQRILRACKEKNIDRDSLQYKFLIICLQQFEIGDSYEITDNGKGALDFVILNKDGKRESFANLGFGSLQLIPLLLEIALLSFAEIPVRHPILISEPESNLHPKLQSKIADMLMAASSVFPFNFIIETHSEYIIRKLQNLVAEKSIHHNHIIIYYLSRKSNSASADIKKITILEDGQLSQEFGPGFFDEADNLAIDLFNMNKINKN